MSGCCAERQAKVEERNRKRRASQQSGNLFHELRSTVPRSEPTRTRDRRVLENKRAIVKAGFFGCGRLVHRQSAAVFSSKARTSYSVAVVRSRHRG